VAILLIVQQYHGLGVEAVKEPFGPSLGAPGAWTQLVLGTIKGHSNVQFFHTTQCHLQF
jgi:hypothetical protein